jgi:broad specificity phosphatase PhoE
MKIILLRHEEREINIGFFSNLTENGMIRSCLLPKKLKKLKIDIIFSSPFIRALQTIYSYSSKYKQKINVEYALYEYLHNPFFLFGKWYYTINDIDDKTLTAIINNNYNSVANKDDLFILENEDNLEKRIIKFFDYLKKNYSNKTILLVTHMGVINKIKDIYVEKTDLNNEFKMGHYESFEIK